VRSSYPSFKNVLTYEREYKTFTVDKTTGETTSMKIREFASQ
jgi:hypothetical protein